MTLEKKNSAGTQDESPIYNISGYRFFPLKDPSQYKDFVESKCLELNLMGSIILSPEGMNLMMAGEKSHVEALVSYLEKVLRFPAVDYRKSYSKEIPYNRLLIKVKKTIVAGESYRFGRDNGQALEPHEFKQWLDESKEMTVIDVRNDYENRVGKFQCAEEFGSYNFNEFPEIARKNLDHLDREKPIVSICTGGIKTEKASMVLKDMGFENVFFLKGGIVRYFEEVGSEHYDGECFVFDKRVAIDSDLKETKTVMCFNCRAPVLLEEQSQESFVPQESCPHCSTRKDQEKVSLERRLEKQSQSSDIL